MNSPERIESAENLLKLGTHGLRWSLFSKNLFQTVDVRIQLAENLVIPPRPESPLKHLAGLVRIKKSAALVLKSAFISIKKTNKNHSTERGESPT
eukprot:s4_g8.t1